MNESMETLSPEARVLVDEARYGEEPSVAQREKGKAALLAAVAGAATGVASAGVEAAALAGSTASAGTGAAATTGAAAAKAGAVAVAKTYAAKVLVATLVVGGTGVGVKEWRESSSVPSSAQPAAIVEVVSKGVAKDTASVPHTMTNPAMAEDPAIDEPEESVSAPEIPRVAPKGKSPLPNLAQRRRKPTEVLSPRGIAVVPRVSKAPQAEPMPIQSRSTGPMASPRTEGRTPTWVFDGADVPKPELSNPVPKSPSEPDKEVANPQPSALHGELVLMKRVKVALDHNLPANALRSLELAERRYPDGALVQERAALKVRALCHLGRTNEALLAQKHFFETWPQSPWAGLVRSPCSPEK